MNPTLEEKDCLHACNFTEKTLHDKMLFSCYTACLYYSNPSPNAISHNVISQKVILFLVEKKIPSRVFISKKNKTCFY